MLMKTTRKFQHFIYAGASMQSFPDVMFRKRFPGALTPLNTTGKWIYGRLPHTASGSLPGQTSRVVSGQSPIPDRFVAGTGQQIPQHIDIKSGRRPQVRPPPIHHR